jgi:hypothetical protein
MVTTQEIECFLTVVMRPSNLTQFKYVLLNISGLEIRESPLYPQKLALTSPTSGGRSVGIVHSRTQTMEIF